MLFLRIAGLAGQLATYAVHAMLFKTLRFARFAEMLHAKILFSEADLSPCYCAYPTKLLNTRTKAAYTNAPNAPANPREANC